MINVKVKELSILVMVVNLKELLTMILEMDRENYSQTMVNNL
jgi:hypothetical protein